MANTMLETIVNIQPKDAGGGGGETRESIVYRLADDMLEKLPEDYIQFEVCVLKCYTVTCPDGIQRLEIPQKIIKIGTPK